jgi:hypothetical protein
MEEAFCLAFAKDGTLAPQQVFCSVVDSTLVLKEGEEDTEPLLSCPLSRICSVAIQTGLASNEEIDSSNSKCVITVEDPSETIILEGLEDHVKRVYNMLTTNFASDPPPSIEVGDTDFITSESVLTTPHINTLDEEYWDSVFD